MRVYHDWEFLERGPEYPIIPISVGMARDDGETLYYVFQEAPWGDIEGHDWLSENVVPHLGGLSDYKSTLYIREKVREFLYIPDVFETELELWGWYSAYDHVCLAQLFGKMINLPNYVPMWTNDLRQEAKRLNTFVPKSELYEEGEIEHNALADAKAERRMGQWLRDYEKSIMDKAMEHLRNI